MKLVLVVVIRPLVVVMQQSHAKLQKQQQGQREHEKQLHFRIGRLPHDSTPV
jgi:hypothetical protein